MVNKGQSALEYMMTYGWAILIIVIVAAVLYSMGIFSPRSSVTMSSTGFAPFLVTGTAANPSDLNVSFSTGGLPNGASTATLNEIIFTGGSGLNSVTGSFTGVFSPSTVASGDTFKATISDGCTTPGASFSVSAILEYTVTTSLGTQYYNTTGTIAGTCS